MSGIYRNYMEQELTEHHFNLQPTKCCIYHVNYIGTKT